MKTSEVQLIEYNSYYKQYIDLVGDAALMDALSNGLIEIIDFFKAIPQEKLNFQYAEGKWTPKEILLHLIDTERVFCYRALQFARSENADVAGFDENEFAENSMANNRTVEDLLDEYLVQRTATVVLFKGFNNLVLKRTGKANGSILSVRASGFIICGHELHHRNIILERYL